MTPSTVERDARRALADHRVFDETLVTGLLRDIDRLREALARATGVEAPEMCWHTDVRSPLK